MLTETPPQPTRKGHFIHLHTKSPKTPIIRQNIYCLYIGTVYMVQLQATLGYPSWPSFGKILPLLLFPTKVHLVYIWVKSGPSYS